MKIPFFFLVASDGKTYTHNDFQSGISVLYLYPKDMTSGCTLEAQDFRNLKPQFDVLGVRIFGLSKDSLNSHEKFCEKESLNFPLLSDESVDLVEKLGSWKEKSMYGKKYFGIDRSTFVIRDGIIIKEWRSVKTKGHVQEVLEYIKNLSYFS